jgi:hypothetical protein
VAGIIPRPSRITAVSLSSVGGAPEGMAFTLVIACNPGPCSGFVEVGLWQRAHFAWKTAAPRASWGVHSDEGIDGGNFRQPAKPKAKVVKAEAIRRFHVRIAFYDTAA